MKVVLLDPWKVIAAGVISCLLVGASVLGALAIWGVFSSDTAEAYGADGVGAKRWYFAEGYTGPGFEEWILVYNPPAALGGSGELVSVDIDMYGNSGYIGVFRPSPIAPGQRASFNINEIALGMYGYSGDISIVASNATYPFICERALYFDYKGQWTGGSQVLGYNEGPAE